MSGLGYLGASAAVGTAIAATVPRAQHDAAMPLVGWRRAVLTVAAFLLGFAIVRLAANLTFGHAALPPWSDLFQHLWLPVLGLAHLLDLVPRRRDAGYGAEPYRTLGWVLLVIGTASVSFDIIAFSRK